MSDLNGTVCFLTGGSGGIGEDIGRRLLKSGVKIFDFSRTKKLEDKIKDRFQNIRSFLGDVGDEDNVKQAFHKCEETFGEVDFLINNAGISIPTPDLSEAEAESYDRMIDTNLRGVFLCTREALKSMKPRKRGHIINVISMAGQRTNPVAPIYVASKFGARGFSGALADQVITEGIKVTDINPGPTDTDYFGDRDVPREKFLKPDDVARVVHFVLSLPKDVLIREVNFDSMKYLASRK